MKPMTFLLCIILSLAGCISSQDVAEVTGPYLGQEPPGMVPIIFAPGIVSTQAEELNLVMTPDGNEMVFTRNLTGRQTLMHLVQRDGQWGKPAPASFSGVHRDVDPFITPDGTRLYFSSNRAVSGNGRQSDCDFWVTERQSIGEWSQARHVDNPSNKGKDDFYYMSTSNGTIYYSIFNADQTGDLYRIRRDGDNLSPSEKLEAPFSTAYSEHDPYVSPEEDFFMFTSNRSGFGRGDLFISFKLSDGSWSSPKNMGETINSADYDYCAMVSPDGKYLFFTSSRTGKGDVYWVDARVIDGLRPR